MWRRTVYSVAIIGLLSSCSSANQAAQRKPLEVVETVDDIMDGLTDCLDYSVNWQKWKGRKKAQGWVVISEATDERLSDRENNDRVLVQNLSHRIFANLTQISQNGDRPIGQLGSCQTHSTVKNMAIAEQAAEKIFDAFHVPEFDPPSSSLNLRSGESINHSTIKNPDGTITFITIVNARRKLSE
jgi:hypothetical protein